MSKFKMNCIKHKLKAIDEAIDKADALYTTAMQKAQDKIVGTTVSTSKTVARKAKVHSAKVQAKIVNR